MKIITGLLLTLFFAAGNAQIVISRGELPYVEPKPKPKQAIEQAEQMAKENQPPKPATPVDEQDFVDFVSDINKVRAMDAASFEGPLVGSMFVSGYDSLLKFYDPLRAPAKNFSFRGCSFEPVVMRDY